MIWKTASFILLALSIALAFLVIEGHKSNALLKRDRALERAKLSKWIYEHSTRISSKTCNEIATEVAKTNKPNLILALITVESEHVQSACSNKGAKGLGQIMFKSHGDALIKKGIIKEERDLYDIIPNVKAIDYVLSMCLKDGKDDVTKALTGYLGGQDVWYVKRILEYNANLDVLAQK